MCFDTPKDNSAKIAREAEEKRQGIIRAGTAKVDQNFAQFNPEYYGQRAAEYRDFYTPQVEQQYKDAYRRVVLGSGATLHSSSGARRLADLFKSYQEQRTRIADESQNYARDIEGRVASNRADLLSQIEGGASVGTAEAGAMARAQQLTQPMQYSPLGDLFGSFVSGVKNDLALQNRGYPGVYRFPGTSSSPSSSVSMVGGGR